MSRYWTGTEWTRFVADASGLRDVDAGDVPVATAADVARLEAPPRPRPLRRRRRVRVGSARIPVWGRVFGVGLVIAIVAGLTWWAVGRDDGVDAVTAARREAAGAPELGPTSCAGADALVEYRLSGASTGVEVSFASASGTVRRDDVVVAKGPATTLHRMCASGGWLLALTAQVGDTGGTVTCEIRRDGRTIAKDTAKGAEAYATCAG